MYIYIHVCIVSTCTPACTLHLHLHPYVHLHVHLHIISLPPSRVQRGGMKRKNWVEMYTFGRGQVVVLLRVTVEPDATARNSE